MRIETVSKYKCDGCGHEETAPYGWVTFMPVSYSGSYVMTTLGSKGEDYCHSCVEKMRAVLKPLAGMQREP